MFTRNHFYSQPQYIDYAALAQARAAEAAAKAAEAEYLAQQAEARVRARPQFGAPTGPSRCSNHYSCTCSACAGPQQSTFPYSPYYEEEYAPVSYGFGGYSYPKRPQRHHQPHYANPRNTQHSLSELELELELKKERLARLQLEQELRQLKAREQQLSQVPFGYPNTQLHPQKAMRGPLDHGLGADDIEFDACTDVHYNPQPRRAEPQPAPAAKRRAAPAKPACRAPAAAEDFITNLILQGLEADRRKQDKGTQKPKVTRKRLEEPPKRPKKVEQEGSLLDQLKARYQREGQGDIRDTIQSVVNSLYPPPKQQSKQSSSPAPAAKQTVNPTPASNNRSGYDLLEALLGQILNQASAQPPSPKPTQNNAPAISSPATAPTNIKGKEKEHAAPSAGTNDSTSNEVVEALKKVEKIERTFQSLQAEFTLPAELDFNPSTPGKDVDSTAIFPHLAFTARNHPVRYYEQTLSSLLQQLDLIDSHGNANLRLRRKRIASAIEKALEELEREVAGRWKAKMAKEQQEGEQVTEASKPTRIPIADGNAKEVSAPKQADSEVIREASPKEEPNPSPKEDITLASEEAPVEAETPKAGAAESVDAAVEDSEIHSEAVESAEASIPAELLPAEDVFSEAAVSPTSDDHETPSSLSESSPSNAEATRKFETDSNSEIQPSLSANYNTESEAERTPEPAPETSLPTPQTADESDPAAKTVKASGEEDSKLDPSPAIEASAELPSSNPSPSSPNSSDNDGLLLARPDSPEIQAAQKGSKPSKRRRSVEVEDLGSDWEDVDDA